MTIPAPFVLANVDWNRNQEYALLLEAVAGYAVLSLGPTFPGVDSTPTGLANDATVYSATVNIDGVNRPVAVTGSAAQTMANLITEIDNDLSTWATTDLIGDIIVITSLNTGPTSTVTVVDTDLFSSLGQTGSAGWGVVSNQSFKGNNRYLRWDKMDGGMRSNLDAAIDDFLAAAVANTNVKWSSGSDAISFPTTSPTSSTDTGLTRSTVYQLNVEVDSDATLGDSGDGELYIDLNISQLGSSTISFRHMLQAINNALSSQGFGASASFDSGSPLTLRILSDSVGTTSTVVITDGASNPLLTALAAFGPVNAPATTAAYADAAVFGAPLGTVVPAIPTNTYDLDVQFDVGGLQQLAVLVNVADDYNTIAATINGLLANGTCAFVNGAFRVTSATLGLGSSAYIAEGTGGPSAGGGFIAAVDAAAAGATTFPAMVPGTDAAGVDGATNVTFSVTKNSIQWDNWNEVLLGWPSLTGFGALFTSGSGMIFEREDKPVTRGDAVETAVYWHVNPVSWRFFENDVTLGATVDPPEA